MPKKPHYEVNATFCDDIRREDNGKMFFIGVYTEGLSVAEFPANFNLSVWLKLTGLPMGESELQFRLIVNGVAQGMGVAPFQIADPAKPLNLFIPMLPINIDRAGSIVLDLMLPNEQSIGSAELDVTGPQPWAVMQQTFASSPSTPG